MQTPPDGNVFFGNNAFIKWAEMLEGDFYTMSSEEFNKGFGIWQRYTIYICIIATNIFHYRDTVGRAITMNPELADIAPLLEKEYKALDELENQLKGIGGDFNVTYEVLQDTAKCKKIARLMRQFPIIYTRICDIIE
jgi:DNA polymerase/3'-5' exonuclease PolX